MSVNNPFTLGYGRLPQKMVERTYFHNEVVDDFRSSYPSTQSYLISGLRGTGKTVFMTALAEEFRRDKDWFVIDLNPERDLLDSLASKLYAEPELYSVLTKIKINFSFLGFGVNIDNVPPITDIETAIELMLEQAQKLGKKVLVTIDEVTSTHNIKVFSNSFQIFIRRNFPIFLIMTGLPENISDIQNQDTLTFLYRSPRINLTPLQLLAMENAYKEVFSFDDKLIKEMAKLTKGYSYAFQVVGHMMWRYNANDIPSVIQSIRDYLYQNSYEKIWSELSTKDQTLLKAIKAIPTKRSEILQNTTLNDNELSVYRKRLVEKGLVVPIGHGYLELTLPLFDDFMREK